jgi:hypothetical protein
VNESQSITGEQDGGPPAICELSILVARTDTRFMLQTIPHLVRACRYPFERRILLVDDAPLGTVYRERPGLGTLEELRHCCQLLIDRGVVDAAVPIDYSWRSRMSAYFSTFGYPFRSTHDLRGYPVLGSIQGVERASADYVVHFDSDMLLYQERGFDWIKRGIDLLEQSPDLLAVLPRSGPPSVGGGLLQQDQTGESFTRRPGLFLFKTFTSRVFLMDRRRYRALLPLSPPLGRKGFRDLLLQRAVPLPEWERMIGWRLAETETFRADLDTDKAWTLHPNCRGPIFEEALPELIRRVEAGEFPPAQGGFYDLLLEGWV